MPLGSTKRHTMARGDLSSSSGAGIGEVTRDRPDTTYGSSAHYVHPITFF
jgi:hypothetical protein